MTSPGKVPGLGMEMSPCSGSEQAAGGVNVAIVGPASTLGIGPASTLGIGPASTLGAGPASNDSGGMLTDGSTVSPVTWQVLEASHCHLIPLHR